MLNIEDCDSILDCGCGSGLLSTELIRRKKDTAKLCLSDITMQMLLRAKHRINTMLRTPFSQEYLTMDSYDAAEVFEPETFSSMNIEFHKANNEDLECFEDGSFDRVIGNLCLHVV